MRSSRSRPVGRCRPVAATLRRFRSDAQGATAVELSLVILPFLALAMGIITIGMQHYVSHSLEHGIEAASRKIKTGEAQKAGLTVADFRELFCDAAGRLIACDKRLQIHIKTSDTFAELSPLTACVTDGNLTPSAASGGDAVGAHAGGKSQRVVVSACYQWDMGLGLWQTVWNFLSPMPTVERRPVLSAVTAFQTEPYE